MSHLTPLLKSPHVKRNKHYIRALSVQLLGLLLTLAGLPLALYRQFVTEARFGFNHQSVAGFFVDLAKQLLIGLLFGAPLIMLVLWLMRESGDMWWLWVWLAWAGFTLLVLAIWPTLIAPRFNKFVPLADGELKQRIEALEKELAALKARRQD